MMKFSTFHVSNLDSAQTRVRKLAPIQQKGLMTVSLLVLAESVALSNAVTFWSTYQNWSNTHGRGRFPHQDSKSGRVGGHFSDFTNTNQDSSSSSYPSSSNFAECKDAPSSATSCSATSAAAHRQSTSTQPASIRLGLYPRTRARLASLEGSRGGGGGGGCSKAIMDCCAATAPSCLDVRGGASFPVAAAMDTIDAAAAGAASSFGSTSSPVPTPYNLPLNLWKIIFQAFLTAMNVLCWLIPLRSKKMTENKLAMGLANAFSGGVFLSLAFGHLIPECVHGFDGYNEAVPFMIVLAGYLLIFFVEKVAFDAHGLMHADCESHEDKGTGTGNGEGGEAVLAASAGLGTGRSAVILLGALAVHSILEMTALGLADSFGDSALLSLSIALHQPAESIALLVAFLKSGMPKDQIVIYLSIFSAMGPIGVALGMAVNEFAAPIVDSIMLATVAGTFVYVGATEVIPEEWEEQEHKWKKFLALISGIVSIFAITQYTMTLEGHAHG